MALNYFLLYAFIREELKTIMTRRKDHTQVISHFIGASHEGVKPSPALTPC
jgi:hypothetical protein